MRFQFEDVTMLAVDAGGQVVELLLGFGRKSRVAMAEGDLGFRDLVVLIEAVHRPIEFSDVSCRTLRGRIGLLRLGAGSHSRLVGRVRSRLRLPNAGLGTRSVWAGEDGPRWEGSAQIPLPQRFVRLPRYQ